MTGTKKNSNNDYYAKNKTHVLEKHKQWKSSNRTRVQEMSKKYYEEHKEAIAARNSERYHKNKAKIIAQNNAYRKKRTQEDPEYKLRILLRARLAKAINGNYRKGSAVRDLGCSIKEFKVYLESKFSPGMSWENHGTWHIDHIKPLKLFNLTIREELLAACHYTNMQPLWAKDNLKKWATYA